jgi:hypothetical protein
MRRLWSTGGDYGGAAEDGVTVVEDCGLARGDAPRRGGQPDQEPASLGAGDGGMDITVRAQLDQAVTWPLGWAASGPHRALGHDVEYVEGFERADGYRP